MPALRRQRAVRRERLSRPVRRLQRLHVLLRLRGLSRRDFHILNERYERTAYFELVSRLGRELRVTLP